MIIGEEIPKFSHRALEIAAKTDDHTLKAIDIYVPETESTPYPAPKYLTVTKLPKEHFKRRITYKRSIKKIGRNEPCPCKSGKKFKDCCYYKNKAKDIADIVEQLYKGEDK